MLLDSYVVAALSTPFPAEQIGWKLQAGFNKDDKGRPQKGLLVAYIDARQVIERLDEVVGPENWHDEYTPVSVGPNRAHVECRLTVGGVTKSDAGANSSDSRDGDDYFVKGAYSDAFKRAAVKFGVGRFLYDLPKEYAALSYSGESKTPKFAIPTLAPHLTWQGNRYWIAQELRKALAAKRVDPDSGVGKEMMKQAVSDAASGIDLETSSLIIIAHVIGKATHTLLKPT